MDALRAHRVVGLAGDPARLVAVCSDECAKEIVKRRPPPATPEEPLSETERVREATIPRIELSADLRTAARRAATAPPSVAPPWAGGGLALAALILSWLAEDVGLAALSAACTAVAAVLAFVRSEARNDIGFIAAAAGPIGAVLAGVAGLLAFSEGAGTGALAGAAIAAGAVVARTWFDRRGRVPVTAVVHDLSARIPPRARVPREHQQTRYEEVDAETLHAGSEVLVIEGETVAVDGVVMSGEAQVLTHPLATVPTRLRAGDTLLAGARIKEGALRVLASRTGEERAFLLPTRYGSVAGPSAARIARRADQVTRIGGLVALVTAPLGLALTGDPGLAGQISAAAAVLLAAPLLAARRGAESPLIAAAASAGHRGVIYQDAAAMEAAGRVATAAVCAEGVITEGRPEVVELHTDGSRTEVLAMIMGAEATVDHPIASALMRYGRAEGVSPAAMRRPQRRRGRGVTALNTRGEPFVIGTRQLLLDEGVSVAALDAIADSFEARGQTALFVGVGGKVRAVVAIQDAVRPGARAAVQRLFDLGIDVVLLSADHRATVEALAGPLDVTNVKAELLPEEQGEAVKLLRDAGGLSAALGRLPFDKEPLESSDVPLYMGHAGLPEDGRGVAIATRDVRDAAAALWIAKAARAEATRGVVLSVGGGGVLMAAAAMGWVIPGFAATLAAAIDAFVLPAGARLLRRIERRLPPN